MDELSNDFKIAVCIYRYNQKGEPIWFSKLVDDFKDEISRVTVSKNIDKLFDLGIISGDWKKLDNGKWIRTFQITDDASGLIKSISERFPD